MYSHQSKKNSFFNKNTFSLRFTNQNIFGQYHTNTNWSTFAERFTDNLGYDGLVLGSSQFSILSQLPLKNYDHFESGLK
jgi:hypothetical protein